MSKSNCNHSRPSKSDRDVNLSTTRVRRGRQEPTMISRRVTLIPVRHQQSPGSASNVRIRASSPSVPPNIRSPSVIEISSDSITEEDTKSEGSSSIVVVGSDSRTEEDTKSEGSPFPICNQLALREYQRQFFPYLIYSDEEEYQQGDASDMGVDDLPGDQAEEMRGAPRCDRGTQTEPQSDRDMSMIQVLSGSGNIEINLHIGSGQLNDPFSLMHPIINVRRKREHATDEEGEVKGSQKRMKRG